MAKRTGLLVPCGCVVGCSMSVPCLAESKPHKRTQSRRKIKGGSEEGICLPTLPGQPILPRGCATVFKQLLDFFVGNSILNACRGCDRGRLVLSGKERSCAEVRTGGDQAGVLGLRAAGGRIQSIRCGRRHAGHLGKTSDHGESPCVRPAVVAQGRPRGHGVRPAAAAKKTTPLIRPHAFGAKNSRSM